MILNTPVAITIIIIFIILSTLLYLYIKKFRNGIKKQPFDNRWMIKDIKKLKFPTNLDYFIYDETLLGYIKLEKNIIPWNTNITIAIPKNSRYISNSISTVEYEIIESDDLIIIYDTFRNKNFELNKNLIFPLQSGVLNEEVEIKYPNRPEEVLSIIYDSQNWNKYCNSMEIDKLKNEQISEVHYSSWEQIKNPPTTLDLFNNTWVINLTKREDRWKSTLDRLKIVGINPKRWDAVDATDEAVRDIYKQVFKKESSDHLTLRELACYLSHYSLWIHLKEKNIPYALILEDDIILPDIKENKDFQKILDNSLGFEILFFGHCLPLTGTKRRFYNHFTERGSALCLHAYGVSATGIENLIKYANASDVVRQVDIVTRNFCADKLCFLSQSKKSTDDAKYWGEGIIVQDRQSLGSDIGLTDDLLH